MRNRKRRWGGYEEDEGDVGRDGPCDWIWEREIVKRRKRPPQITGMN